MNFFVRFVYFAVISATSVLSAEESHPIDLAMEKAMEKDSSTAGMIRAAQEALVKWEGLVDDRLGSLQQIMSPEEFTALKASQKSWKLFYRLETEAQGEIYKRMEGTMWRPASVMQAMELIKQRALTLSAYVDTISER